jgi:hypothetical protein
MARQRPQVADRRTELETDPIGQPVPERGANRARDPDRPEIQTAGADERADPDKRGPGRKQQRDEGKRFAKREREHDRRGPRLVDAHEFNEGLGVSFEALEHMAGGLIAESRFNLPRAVTPDRLRGRPMAYRRAH